MAESESTWAFSHDFETQFQELRTQLGARIDALKGNSTADALSTLSLDVAKLAKLLADATGSLPNYAQRQCELQVKALEKSLEELRTSVPKTKFAFKRKAPAPTVPSPPSASAGVAAAKPSPAPTATTNLSISCRSKHYLSLDALPPRDAPSSDLTISDLTQCIVNLLPPGDALQISALHIRNLADCVLLLPTIRGSILLHDLHRCVVVVGCHQFRMHTSTNVDVYLSISSNPIIEHCSKIRFCAYPTETNAPLAGITLSGRSNLSIPKTPYFRNWMDFYRTDCLSGSWTH
ncbi:C-CAP/cofactor C-like domain-containing protein [Mycena kentingensis (nom. inval.)]|nr:C-CAP/cofactor C-like domain-containing protein [Mycena kentingensis (nom. inval.)]